MDGKNTTRIVETLGTEAELRQKFPDKEPLQVAQERLQELNLLEKAGRYVSMPRFSNARRIPKGQQFSYQGGYLFLQKIFHSLKLDKICREIAARHSFDFDLSDILSRLLYTRILSPGSKLSSYEDAKDFLEAPGFALHDIYRALSVLAEENDFIQASVYKYSKKLTQRNDKILFYDCTNYFFEIEAEDGMRMFSKSKENRPNPVVQMGLFLDASGFPLAFTINPGNTGKQVTMRPLEKKILRDFQLSKFIVCTDAGLSSTDNRKFNNRQERAFVTTQSLKKIKGHLREWALDPTGWSLGDSHNTYDLRLIKEDDPEEYNRVYYKRRPILEDGLEQDLIVTFSLKYRFYLQHLRGRQEEESFDGYYAVCTNLDAHPLEIIAINKQRWLIEAAFRTLKSEFKARPVYVQRKDRILAHFMTCFLALLIYKILKQKVDGVLTGNTPSGIELVEQLRQMNFFKISGEGYIPTYTRNNLTDALHEAFGFRTDYEILSPMDMRKILAQTKK